MLLLRLLLGQELQGLLLHQLPGHILLQNLLLQHGLIELGHERLLCHSLFDRLWRYVGCGRSHGSLLRYGRGLLLYGRGLVGLGGGVRRLLPLLLRRRRHVGHRSGHGWHHGR